MSIFSRLSSGRPSSLLQIARLNWLSRISNSQVLSCYRSTWLRGLNGCLNQFSEVVYFFRHPRLRGSSSSTGSVSLERVIHPQDLVQSSAPNKPCTALALGRRFDGLNLLPQFSLPQFMIIIYTASLTISKHNCSVFGEAFRALVSVSRQKFFFGAHLIDERSTQERRTRSRPRRRSIFISRECRLNCERLKCGFLR
jgi:hypothetical protein